MNTSEYDAIVVGGGPAGLSAGGWLGRFRRRTLVLDSGEHRNRWVERSHGYLGVDPASPRDLLERAREQLLAYPHVDIVATTASRVEGEHGSFTVTSGDGTFHGRRLVLATGVVDRFPDVRGFYDHYGASIFHCPTCDGYEARDRDVVVFGWSRHVTGFAVELLNWARSVVIVTDGRRFQGDDEQRSALDDHGISVLTDEASETVGSRGDLRGIRLASGELLTCDLAFFSIAHEPRTELARSLGCASDDEGYVRIDHEGATTVAGVYAAGDVAPGLQLIQVAAAQGTAAGVACAESF